MSIPLFLVCVCVSLCPLCPPCVCVCAAAEYSPEYHGAMQSLTALRVKDTALHIASRQRHANHALILLFAAVRRLCVAVRVCVCVFCPSGRLGC